MEEIYFSTDIETDGPIPGRNSMLSFGSAAFSVTSGLIGTFSANLELLPGATPDEKTKTEFWDKNPEAWAACRENPRPIEATMRAFVDWVRAAPGKPVFVGYPATFDFMFIYWYMIAHGVESPFSFSALDIKSYVCALLDKSFRDVTKRSMPKSWFPKNRPHTHVAIDDAIEQGELFMNILQARHSGLRITSSQRRRLEVVFDKYDAPLAFGRQTLSVIKNEVLQILGAM